MPDIEAMTSERRFIATLDSLEFTGRPDNAVLPLLHAWLAELIDDLTQPLLASEGLQAHSALAGQVDALNAELSNGVVSLSTRWRDLEAAEALADLFPDRLLLLVFGKFNSGKSSFCNLLAERFKAFGHAAHYFVIERGGVVESDQPLVEGATEATTHLQGIRLADKLVILDTPGLHSATPENAATARRFVESADGVLWLTSSTAPGQVQELEELGRELRRNKPLLPVITRSDYFDEDEVDGAIVKVLRNKSEQNRALQEADVAARTLQKLASMGVDSGLLISPASISAHLAGAAGATPEASTDAGLERLYAALLDILAATLTYKSRKRAEIVLHHLQENGVAMLRRMVFPRLTEIEVSAQAAIEALVPQRLVLIDTVWRSVVPWLPRLLDDYAEKRNLEQVYKDLLDSITASFNQAAKRHLADFSLPTQWSLVPSGVPLRYGQANRTLPLDETQSAGTMAPKMDYHRLYKELEQVVRQQAGELAQQAMTHCQLHLQQLIEAANPMQQRLLRREQTLSRIEATLRTC